MENPTAKDRYKFKNKIGFGAFGEVYSAIDCLSGRKVAIKSVPVSVKGISKALYRELLTLQQLSSHPIKSLYVVDFHEHFVDDSTLHMVVEYIPYNLSQVISQSKSSISASCLKSYALMLFEALNFCHQQRIIHRDIKPSNLLITYQGRLKLADFGLARILPLNPHADDQEPLTHQIQTRWYRSPELLFASRHYDFAIDIWSSGAVLSELRMRAPLFPGKNDIDQIFKVFQIMGTPSETSWPDVVNLPDYNKVSFPTMAAISLSFLLPTATKQEILFLESLLQLNPSSRLTAKQAVDNEYFFLGPPPALLSAMPVINNHDITGSHLENRKDLNKAQLEDLISKALENI